MSDLVTERRTVPRDESVTDWIDRNGANLYSDVLVVLVLVVDEKDSFTALDAHIFP